MKKEVVIIITALLFLIILTTCSQAQKCSEGYLDNYKCQQNTLLREYQTSSCQKTWKEYKDCSEKDICPMSGNTLYKYSCKTPFLGIGKASCQAEKIQCLENKKCAVWGCTEKTKALCKDGTENGKCSSKTLKGIGKPKYCQDGELTDNCQLCGCEQGHCLSNGKCLSTLTTEPATKNRPPVTTNPPPLYLVETQENLQNLLDLTVYASDSEQQQLEFSFEEQETFTSEIIDCTLSQDARFSCNKPKQEGRITIPVIVSDGEKQSILNINIDVFPATTFGDLGPGGTSFNSPPKADAGEDKIAFPYQKIILDGSRSYDRDNNIPEDQTAYAWYHKQEIIGYGKVIEHIFETPGKYTIFLKVTDSKGISSTDKITVTVTEKRKCKDTKTAYFPIDTLCNSKWPTKEGNSININSEILSCNLFEVCDDSIDYIIEDAISCCKDRSIEEGDKKYACDYAIKNSGKSQKKCQALYIIQSLGGSEIYMKDYFEAEMCCYGEEALCTNPADLYKPRPLPTTRFDLNNIRCYTTRTKREKGEWLSDTRIDKNNIALSDIPVHASINILGTGTCVDYSAALTTLLRKAGYKKNEAYTVESPTHAYNLVRFPYDKKYTVVDTTGNNNPAVILGETPSSILFGFDYCGEIKKCYNDKGPTLCPSQQDIYGCENTKVSFTMKTYYTIQKAKNVVGSFFTAIKEEVTR